MDPTRRDFLTTSLAAGSLVSWGLTVPRFLSRTAAAAPLACSRLPRSTRLARHPC